MLLSVGFFCIFTSSKVAEILAYGTKIDCFSKQSLYLFKISKAEKLKQKRELFYITFKHYKTLASYASYNLRYAKQPS